MASEIDNRLVRIGIEIRGQIKYYDDLWVTATGTKYANENQNEAEFKIANLDRETRDYLLSETSPFNKNRTPKKIFLSVGRVSTGLSQIYVGDITSASVSQPPDITITLKCATGDAQKGEIVAKNQPGMTMLSTIAKQVADDLKLSLNFQAKDKQISNYSFTGGALKQVEKLGQAGNVNAYVDDNKLIVKDWGKPLSNSTRVLNVDTGMIGQPEVTDRGIKVTYLIDHGGELGGGVEIQSKLNPSINGVYSTYKLSFNIASRDTPFYWIAEASRV